jgi:ribonuclease BN (tRNA processing enzyme)
MQITFLGTGTGLPNKQRAPSGLLVRVGDTDLLFDSGSGTMGRVLAVEVEPTRLDYLYYTHVHTDHTADLIPLLQAMDLSKRTRDLHLTAPSAFWNFLDGLLAVQPWARPSRYQLVRHSAETSPYCGANWNVSAAPTRHIPGSFGYRLESEGKAMVYSGDAAFCEELVKLSRNADVLILECSYPDQLAQPDHLTPSQAGRIAAEANALHLVLTHFYPVCQEAEIEAQARKVFPGPVTLASDGLMLTI